jgi:fructose-bisphosphate aldolase class 1
MKSKNLLSTREIKEIKKEMKPMLISVCRVAGLSEKEAVALLRKMNIVSTPQTLTISFSKALKRGEKLSDEISSTDINEVLADAFEEFKKEGLSSAEAMGVLREVDIRVNPKSLTVNVAKIKLPKL